MPSLTVRLGAVLTIIALAFPAATATAGPEGREGRSAAWEFLAPLPFGLWGAAGASVDGCTFFTIGGQDENSVVRNTVELLDPQLNTWSFRAPMPQGRYGLTAGVVGQKVYVVGGYTDGAIARENFIYDATTDSWSTGASIPPAGGIATAATASFRGRVYVIGGDDGDVNSNDTNLEYNPATDTWRNRAPMPTPRENNVAVALNGKIYVAGGLTAQIGNDGLTRLESYDPRTDTWTQLAGMIFPRISPGIATDGRYIYVYGGAATYDPFAPLQSTERYDPVRDAWTQMARMGKAVDAAASGYADGRLLSAGGDYRDITQSLTIRASSC